MAPSTIDVSRMNATDRKILDFFKEGVGVRTIALRVGMEHGDVQDAVDTLVGGERHRSAAVIAAYDREHGTSPAGGDQAQTHDKTRPEQRTTSGAGQVVPDRPDQSTTVGGHVTDLTFEPDPPAKTGRPVVRRRAAHNAATVGQRADTAQPAPTVVPVDLSETVAADTPAAPAPQPPAATQDAPLQATPAPDLTTEQRALDGPTNHLPEVHSFEELMGVVARLTAADPVLAALARDLTDRVKQLYTAYDRVRQTRIIRGEAVLLRRELDTRLARLAQLNEPASSAPTGATA